MLDHFMYIVYIVQTCTYTCILKMTNFNLVRVRFVYIIIYTVYLCIYIAYYIMHTQLAREYNMKLYLVEIARIMILWLS